MTTPMTSDSEAQSEAPSKPSSVDEIIDTCLHPERNGLLLKEQVAEGASYEWLVKRELKAKINRLIVEARLGMLDYFDQVPRNDVMDWKGLFADTRMLLNDELQELSNNLSKGEDNDN